jgi:hypothetical protein
MAGHFSDTPMTLQYVVKNKDAIGFILRAGTKGWRAYDESGRSIGLFDNQDDAAKAVYEQANTAPVAEGG